MQCCKLCIDQKLDYIDAPCKDARAPHLCQTMSCRVMQTGETLFKSSNLSAAHLRRHKSCKLHSPLYKRYKAAADIIIQHGSLAMYISLTVSIEIQAHNTATDWLFDRWTYLAGHQHQLRKVNLCIQSSRCKDPLSSQSGSLSSAARHSSATDRRV